MVLGELAGYVVFGSSCLYPAAKPAEKIHDGNISTCAFSVVAAGVILQVIEKSRRKT